MGQAPRAEDCRFGRQPQPTGHPNGAPGSVERAHSKKSGTRSSWRLWSRPPLKRQGQAENARSWGLRSPPGGIGDFPTTSQGLGAGCEHSVTWGRLGRRRVGRAPKASGKPGSPTPRATPLAVPPPHAGILGWPAGGVGAYRCVQGTFPFPGAGAEPSSLSSRQGIPLPQLRDPPRAPCPLCQGEKAAELETKKLLPASTLCPSTRPRHSPAPSLDPGDTESTHAEERDQGTGSRVGESAFPTPRGYSCPCTPPGDAPRQPRPHHPLPKASRVPDTATPAQTASTIPPAERQGGAAHTKRMGSKEPRGERDPAGARGSGFGRLFTRFLLRSLRCLRR